MAQRIGNCVRAGDCVARLGGDEFTVLLDTLSSPSAASVAANKISRALAAPFEIDGHDIFVAASIGISVYPTRGEDVSTLLRRADTAMYRAKRGNTGYAFYEPSMEATVSRAPPSGGGPAPRPGARRAGALLPALRRTDDLRIIGMEALVRWQHPKRGMVPPVEFIPWRRRPASSCPWASGCCAPPAPRPGMDRRRHHRPQHVGEPVRPATAPDQLL